jgi:hypothetical protein
MTLPETLGGGVLFSSCKLLKCPSDLVVKVILATFMGLRPNIFACVICSCDPMAVGMLHILL